MLIIKSIIAICIVGVIANECHKVGYRKGANDMRKSFTPIIDSCQNLILDEKFLDDQFQEYIKELEKELGIN